MNKNLVVVVALCCLVTCALAADPPPPGAATAQPPGAPGAPPPDNSPLTYVGTSTRFGIGYDSKTKVRGDVYQIFNEDKA